MFKGLFGASFKDCLGLFGSCLTGCFMVVWDCLGPVYGLFKGLFGTVLWHV